MGLLDKLRGRQKGTVPVRWDEAYAPTPQFAAKNGIAFGTLTLTEGVPGILPLAPQERYRINDRPVTRWRLALVSSASGLVGTVDYFAALDILRDFAHDRRRDAILIRGLKLWQMEDLVERCGG